LAAALAEHLGINEKAKLLFQNVMTSDDLSYLVDEEFLMEGIKRIDNVSNDDSLKDKGSTSHYAESVSEDSDESDVEDSDESNDSQDDQHAQGNSVSCKESQAGRQNRVTSASTTSNDEHVALSRLPRAIHRRGNARISTGRDVLDDSSTALEGIAFTAETIEMATNNCRLMDTTPIIPANRQARLTRRRISSQNGVGGSSALNGERVNGTDVLVSGVANMNLEADDGDDEVQSSAMAKNATSSARQLQTSKLNKLLNSNFVASRGRGGRASTDTGEDPLTKQIGFFGELFVSGFIGTLPRRKSTDRK
jgi:hypothetical protein